VVRVLSKRPGVDTDADADADADAPFLIDPALARVGRLLWLDLKR
jgi:hypothetical protein